ncbi:tRNA-modifying protein YgfZ [Gammaproteobacteria bacterium]|nr:tRNA-modifying protein YgfZ [Gammaproteobacteria bacterium]
MAGFLIQKVNNNFKIIIEEFLIEAFVEDLMPYAKFFGVTFYIGDENVLGRVVDSLEKSNNNSFLTNGSFDLEVEIKEDKKSISNEISQDKWQIANKIALNHSLCFDDIALYRPLELNYDKLRVSFTKGCFRGQEIIARMHYLGVNRRSFCAVIENTEHPLENNIKPLGEKLECENYKIYNCFIEQDIQNDLLKSNKHELFTMPTNQLD